MLDYWYQKVTDVVGHVGGKSVGRRGFPRLRATNEQFSFIAFFFLVKIENQYQAHVCTLDM